MSRGRATPWTDSTGLSAYNLDVIVLSSVLTARHEWKVPTVDVKLAALAPGGIVVHRGVCGWLQRVIESSAGGSVGCALNALSSVVWPGKRPLNHTAAVGSCALLAVKPVRLGIEGGLPLRCFLRDLLRFRWASLEGFEGGGRNICTVKIEAVTWDK